VPGVLRSGRGRHLRGIALTGVRTTIDVDDVLSVDFEALATAVPRGLAATVDAGDLAAIRDGLLAAGLDGATPVTVTGDGTGDTQYTTASTVDSFVAAALGFFGPGRARLGPGWPTGRSSAGGRTGRCTAGRCWYRGRRSRPAR